MKTENLNSKPVNTRTYLRYVLLVLGAVAVTAASYVAWPALVHIGSKLI